MNRIGFVRAKGLVILSLSVLPGVATSSEVPDSPGHSIDLEKSADSAQDAIHAVRKIASETPNNAAVPKLWKGSVKHYSGISHSFHRVTVHGQGLAVVDDAPPAQRRSYHAFYYDSQGQLRLVTFHPSEGNAYVTDQILYNQQRPMARVSYSAEGLSYIDYVHYQKASPVASCRMLRDGAIVLLKKLRDEKPASADVH